MTSYEHPKYAPVVKRKPCKRCGTTVDTFTDPETGLIRLLDIRPVMSRLAAQSGRSAWIDRGPRIGWCQVSTPALDETRELRFAHECGGHRE